MVNVGTVGSCAWSVQIWKISKDEQQQQPVMRYAISLGGPIIYVGYVGKRTGRWCLEKGGVCCIIGARRQLAMCVWSVWLHQYVVNAVRDVC